MNLSRTAAAVLLAPLLAGCGAMNVIDAASPDDDRGGGGGPVTAEQITWMEGLCGGLAEVVDTVTGLPVPPTTEDTAALGQVYSDQMTEIGTSVDGLLTTLDTLGPPPVDDGAGVQADLRESFTTTREGITVAEEAVTPTNFASPIGYAQGVRALENGFTAGRATTDEASTHSALADAFDATPSCQDVDAAASGRPGTG